MFYGIPFVLEIPPSLFGQESPSNGSEVLDPCGQRIQMKQPSDVLTGHKIPVFHGASLGCGSWLCPRVLVVMSHTR